MAAYWFRLEGWRNFPVVESWKQGLNERTSLSASASTFHHSHGLLTITILLKQLGGSNLVV